MTTHEQGRVMGVLRGDPQWNRNHLSLWGQGWLHGYQGRPANPRYYCGLFMPTTDPAEVEEYRQGYEMGQQRAGKLANF